MYNIILWNLASRSFFHIAKEKIYNIFFVKFHVHKPRLQLIFTFLATKQKVNIENNFNLNLELYIIKLNPYLYEFQPKHKRA